LAPSKVFTHSKSDLHFSKSQFTPDEHKLFPTRFEDGFDLEDPKYFEWLRIHHPEVCSSSVSTGSTDEVTSVGSSASVSHRSPSVVSTCAPGSMCSLTTVSTSSPQASSSSQIPESDCLSEILVLPKPKPTRQKREGVNSRAVVITDDEVVRELQEKEEAKKLREAEKERKRIEREQKKREREKKKRAQQEEREEKKKRQEKKRTVRDQKRKQASRSMRPRRGQKTRGKGETRRTLVTESEKESESDAECPVCGLAYGNDDCVWICCDCCDSWYHLACADISDDEIPDQFLCVECFSK